MNRLANKGIPTANISTALPRLAARLCLTLLVIAITVSCRSIPAEAALRDEQFTGSVQSVPMTALDMSEQTEQYTSRIEIPFFEGEEPLNEEISAILRSQYAIFRASIPKEQSDALRQSDASLETGTPPYEFIFNWTYKRINPAFISLYFNSYYYTGGANGIQTCFSVNYNNETGEFITLADLLGTDKPGWLEELSQTVRKQLEETINIAGDSVLTGMIEEGTTPDEKNFSVFVFDETTITLYFQKYQTAPGSFGILSAIKKRK